MKALSIQARAAARVSVLGLVAIGVEWSRALTLRAPGFQALTLVAGGVALCLLAVGSRPADLGLGTSRIIERVIGGLALTAVLLLPAAFRWTGGPVLGPQLAVAAVAVSVGEEIAFRGVLYAALDSAYGPAAAVLGSTGAWTLSHALSHPPAFLPAVATAGLLLATWRWAARDLVAPIIGHSLADLAL